MRRDTEGWTDIVSVSAASHSPHTVGLCTDGTVATVGGNSLSQCDVGDWKNIAQVAVGKQST